jgi:hypothetical protein
MRLRTLRSFLAAGALALACSAQGLPVQAAPPSGGPNLGPNVLVFDPSMKLADIQAAVNGVAAQQVNSEFGTGRYALLFKPGTYGSSTNPLTFQVGYYTTVAGLGQSPDDVVINGSIDVFDRCLAPDGGNCIALVNFWRSLSNLHLNVVTPRGGCRFGEFWAVSQAAPMRRVHVNGLVTLMDYCLQPAFASGGFIADSEFDGSVVINGSQQQWITRNSKVDLWTNAVWNQVFSGVIGAPAQSFPNPTFTTLATSPVTREAPYLYLNSAGKYNVFVPAVQHDSSGTTWASGPTPGTSISIDNFFVARPGDRVSRINSELARGRGLILTPGIYHLDRAIEVKRAGTVVLGLGMPTLVPTEGNAAIEVADEPGVLVSGLIVDAGAQKSSVLMQLGNGHESKSRETAADPAGLYDVFFRIGGAAPGKAGTALVVNSDNVILDDIWSWRADHGSGVGWTSNTADTGALINGDNVTAYGLFVEHYQKFNVIWNGNNGTDVFFQNELPYDVPSQAAWMESPGVNGFAAFKVGDSVTSFAGYGMGSYSFFNQHAGVFADHAFEVPATLPKGSLHDLLTIFLDAVNGDGGISHVVNDQGGSSTATNADAPVTVNSSPVFGW